MMSKQSMFVVGVLVVLLIIAIAAIAAAVEAEKDVQRGKGKMSTVYGKSFMNLPHGPLESTSLQRSIVGTPQFEFHPMQVAGSSFDRL